MDNGDPLYVGLMSGTSVDAIDCAMVRCSGNKVMIVATHEHAIPPHVKTQIAAISHSGKDEIERMGVLDRLLGRLFAEATMQLLHLSSMRPEEIKAIGSHGQTIRHRPPSAAADGKSSFSLQIGDPNTIAEMTSITTIADFRRRDIAAGGEGAPLAPAFHAAAFAKAGVIRAVVNIGGIANASILDGKELLMGFDTGPGNTLLDHWIARHHGQSYDHDGQWSAAGQTHDALLQKLLAHSYFSKTGARSTGKEAFNLPWLDSQLAGLEPIAARDVQTTLMELTCISITNAIRRCPLQVAEVYICGGGSHNAYLMQRLAQHLAPATLANTSVLGIDPDWVEAVTFAWLASRTLEGLSGNSPMVTGASGARILGGLYPGRYLKI